MCAVSDGISVQVFLYLDGPALSVRLFLRSSTKLEELLEFSFEVAGVDALLALLALRATDSGGL